MKNEPASSTARIGGVMITLAWIIALGLLTVFFNNWLVQQRNPNREIQTHANSDGVLEVRLKRNRYGHYLAMGRINGQTVEFLVDTGATDVSIPGSLAKKLGLKTGPRIRVHTANGMIEVRHTRLAQIELGPISLTDISANINPHMPDESVLLGMSFLENLEFTQRGDTLTLRQNP